MPLVVSGAVHPQPQTLKPRTPSSEGNPWNDAEQVRMAPGTKMTSTNREVHQVNPEPSTLNSVVNPPGSEPETKRVAGCSWTTTFSSGVTDARWLLVC